MAKQIVEPLFAKFGSKLYPIKSYKGASERFTKTIAIAERDLLIPASDIVGIPIVNKKGVVVANVAYNGNVFKGAAKDWTPKTKLLYGKRYKSSLQNPDVPKKRTFILPDEEYDKLVEDAREKSEQGDTSSANRIINSFIPWIKAAIRKRFFSTTTYDFDPIFSECVNKLLKLIYHDYVPWLLKKGDKYIKVRTDEEAEELILMDAPIIKASFEHYVKNALFKFILSMALKVQKEQRRYPISLDSIREDLEGDMPTLEERFLTEEELFRYRQQSNAIFRWIADKKSPFTDEERKIIHQKFVEGMTNAAIAIENYGDEKKRIHVQRVWDKAKEKIKRYTEANVK